MKKKISVLLSVFLILPLFLTGCGKDGKKLLEQAVANAGDAQSCTMDLVFEGEFALKNSFPISPKIALSIEMDENLMHFNLETDRLFSMALFNSYAPVSEDLYIQCEDGKVVCYGNDSQSNGAIKTTMDSAEYKVDNLSTLLSPDAASISVLTNLSKSIKVTGQEEIKGVRCDVVTLKFDSSKILNLAKTSMDADDHELTDQEKILLEGLCDCVEIRFYIGCDDVKLHSIQMGTNDSFISVLNMIIKEKEQVGEVSVNDFLVEFGLTGDYQNKLPGLPAKFQSAEEVDQEQFLSRNALFKLINNSSNDDNFLEIFENSEENFEDLLGA